MNSISKQENNKCKHTFTRNNGYKERKEQKKRPTSLHFCLSRCKSTDGGLQWSQFMRTDVCRPQQRSYIETGCQDVTQYLWVM